jgi:predicted transposase/invertase (TIGR01784 family)
MVLGICPLVDFAFKLMLGSPEHTAVTIHFLNAVLDGLPRITQVTILNPILDKESADDKLAVLDILAKDEFGRLLNIEMQTSLPAGLSQRLTYYASSLYCNKLDQGEDYPRLRPAICICVLERALFSQHPQLHLDFRLREANGTLLTDDLQIHLVELPKSRATAHNIEEVSPLERWAFFLRNAEHLTTAAIRELLPEPEFAEAAGVLEMIGRTPEQERQYAARLKFQRDEAARLLYAREEGLAEGEAKGEQLGRLKGQIQLLEQLLGLTQSTLEALAPLSMTELSALVETLQRKLRERSA